MSAHESISPAILPPSLGPASRLLIEARTLERAASALMGQARRESACRLATASVHSNDRALELLKKAESLRRKARRVQG